MITWRWLNRFFRKARNIAKGWYYFAIHFDPPYAKERRKICKPCPSNKLNICTECGCPLWAKPRIKDEECPLGKWGKDLP